MCRGPVKRRTSVSYARALSPLLDSADVVHAHLHASLVAATLAGMSADVPLVVTEHSEGAWRGMREKAIGRWCLRRADTVIAVSHTLERRLIDELGRDAARVTVVPNAIGRWQTDGHRAPPESEAGDTTRPVVGMVGRLAPEKGGETFVRAAALIAARHPEVRFVLAGDGPEGARLRDIASRLDLAGRLRFAGEVPDARRWIAGMDVLAVPSLSEGAPLVVLEAMASGTPVVASAAGGIPEQIGHEREGLLVPPGNACLLAGAIVRLLEDGETAARLASAARLRARREFEHGAMVDRVEGIYRAVLHARACARHHERSSTAAGLG